MRYSEIKSLKECATSGATSAGAVATSMGNGAGFGTSIFMRRSQKKPKKSKQ